MALNYWTSGVGTTICGPKIETLRVITSGLNQEKGLKTTFQLKNLSCKNGLYTLRHRLRIGNRDNVEVDF